MSLILMGDKVKVKFLQSDEKLVNLNPLESPGNL